MTTVAFRIPEELKHQMSRVKINWSEYVRGSIQEALASERKRQWFAHMKQRIGKLKSPLGTADHIVRSLRDNG